VSIHYKFAIALQTAHFLWYLSNQRIICNANIHFSQHNIWLIEFFYVHTHLEITITSLTLKTWIITSVRVIYSISFIFSLFVWTSVLSLYFVFFFFCSSLFFYIPHITTTAIRGDLTTPAYFDEKFLHESKRC